MIAYTETLDLMTLLNRVVQEGETQLEYQGRVFTIKPENFEPLSVQLVRECREESANRWDRFFEERNQ